MHHLYVALFSLILSICFVLFGRSEPEEGGETGRKNRAYYQFLGILLLAYSLYRIGRYFFGGA